MKARSYFEWVLSERQLTLTQAAHLLPQRPSVSCVYRWTRSGCRGILLESWQAGCSRVTSHEAVARFIERLTLARSPKIPQAVQVHTTEARRQQSQVSGQLLDALGFQPPSRSREGRS